MALKISFKLRTFYVNADINHVSKSPSNCCKQESDSKKILTGTYINRGLFYFVT